MELPTSHTYNTSAGLNPRRVQKSGSARLKMAHQLLSKRSYVVLLMLMLGLKSFAQPGNTGCTGLGQSSCCANSTLNLTVTGYTYTGGNNVSVNFSFTATSGCDGYFTQAFFNYGDGLASTNLSMTGSNTWTVNHVYTLPNICGPAVYTINACGVHYMDKTDISQMGGCTTSTTLSIPHPASSFSLHAGPVPTPGSCYTYSFSYTSTLSLLNAQIDFGDGNYGASATPTSGATAFTHTYSTPGTYTVILTGNGISPCNTVSTTINVGPPAAADFSAALTSSCAPTSLSVTIPTYTSANTYSLVINTTTTACSGSVNTISSGLAPGVNTITLITAHNGCYSTVTKTISVPGAFGITATSTGCNSFNFSYSGSTIPNAQWAFGDGANSATGVQSTSHTYPGPGTYVVSLLGSGTEACPAFTTVTIAAVIEPDFTYSLVNQCDYTQGLILTIPNYNLLTYSYNWYINNLIIGATGQSAVYTANLQPGNNIIKLEVSNGTCVTSVIKNVMMGSPSAVFSTFSQNLCVGDPLSVFNVSSGADSYSWAIVPTVTTPSVLLTGMNPIYTFTNTDTYNVTLTTKTGTCTNNYSMMFTVSSMPDATFSMTPLSCSNGITLTSTGSPTVFTSYTVNYGDGTVYTGTGNSIPTASLSHTYSTNGVFPVTIQLSNNGCQSQYSQNVNVSNSSALSIGASGNYICPGSSVLLTPQVITNVAGAGSYSYTWTGPNSFSSSLASITATAGGVYNLTVTSAGACSLHLTASKTLTLLARPSATVLNISNITCLVSTGSATLAIPDSLAILGYVVNGATVAANPGLNPTGTVQAVVSNLTAGANYITVSNLLDPSCHTNVLVNITQTEPAVNVTPTQPTSCSGSGSQGSAVVNITGGTGTVSWYTLQGYPTNSVISTGSSISNLNVGSYVVSNVYGSCTVTANFSIQQPVINLSKNGGAAGTCTNATTPVTINAQFVPSSVNPSFNYSLTNMITNTAAVGTASVYSLTAGNYSVLVSANNCTAALSINITSLSPIALTLKTNSPTCINPGDITAVTSGGDGNYTFDWYMNGVTTPTNNNAVLNLDGITAATSISVSVTDQSGCHATYPATPITISPAPEMTLVVCTPTNGAAVQNSVMIDACSIGACVTGGQGPYTFEWYTPATSQSFVEWQFKYDENNNFIGFTSTQTVTQTAPPGPSPATITAASYTDNTDGSTSTVVYPYWSGTPLLPAFNSVGVATPSLAGSTSTDPVNYYTVMETLTLTSDQLVASFSGESGTMGTNKDFVTGPYKIKITDANGCSKTWDLGVLTFSQDVTPLPFTYVWGMNKRPVEDVSTALQSMMVDAASEMQNAADKCEASKLKNLQTYLKDNCSDLSQVKDQLNISYDVKEHHYTLYYYDRAGRLTKTVPPQGVHLLSRVQIDAVIAFRESGGSFPGSLPVHSMATRYKYNSLGQLISQTTPDGGTTNFIYDGKNRLRFSQNDKQAVTSPKPVYSYTKYDALGRIIEVGESILNGPDFTNLGASGNLALADNAPYPTSNNKQVTTTVYSDAAAVTYYGQPQRYLQNRVSYTYLDEDPTITGDEYYTYYSYDSHGNVEWLAQEESGGVSRNYIAYDYDLVSGKVLQVSYNDKRNDRFYHRYVYDAENRLLRTETSRNGELWDADASYQYYPHGPLMRNELGEDHVQGLDYIYTLNGWIKSVNSPNLSNGDDPGSDNTNTTPVIQERFAADRFGMVLNYFSDDYSTNATNFLTSGSYGYDLASFSATSGLAPSLYNGNISGWIQSQMDITATTVNAARADLFRYDVLNRIRQSASQEEDGSGGWQNINSSTNTYSTNYSYDANGNILTLNRFEDQGGQMDALSYAYNITGASTDNNLLLSVADGTTSSANGRSDLQGTHSYSYDAIGNLIEESGDEMISIAGSPGIQTIDTKITWTVYGKIKEINKTVVAKNLKERITFFYDPAGNRIRKEHWKDDDLSPNGTEDENEITETYYVRDAQGNTMAVYETEYIAATPEFHLNLIEQPIYGSERVGENTLKVLMAKAPHLNALAMPGNGTASSAEYQNWITTTSKTQLLPGGTMLSDNLCQCKVVSLDGSNYTNLQTAVQFLGIANNGVAVAEDIHHNLQFYVVLAQKYLGQNDACLIFDKYGKLMKNTDNIISVNPNSKPVIVNIPGSNKYAVVTVNSNQQPVYHIVDMDLTGYGPLGGTGEVVAYDQPLTPASNTSMHGYHFTGMEDHMANYSVVYASRFTPDPLDPSKGTTDIMSYNFGTATTTPASNVIYSIYGCGSTEQGQLQISPDGNKLGWWEYDKQLGGFDYRNATIYTLPLSSSKTALGTGAVDMHNISAAGNYGNGMLDFMKNSSDILYSQRGVYKENSSPAPTDQYDRNVWNYNPVNVSTISINPASSPLTGYLFGEIKRGIDGNYYIPQMGRPLDQIHSYSGSAFNSNLPGPPDTLYKLTSGLPTQVYKIFADPSQGISDYTRPIGNKDYELKDHLGNVRVVISDVKQVVDVDNSNTISSSDNFTPEIKNFTDYYAFGMSIPNRMFNAGNYRYGYNGKENDNEVKGIGNEQDYGMRMYDPRIGKFFSEDPITDKYPELTPYQFASNRPIDGIDLDGLEFFGPIGALSTAEMVTKVGIESGMAETIGTTGAGVARPMPMPYPFPPIPLPVPSPDIKPLEIPGRGGAAPRDATETTKPNIDPEIIRKFGDQTKPKVEKSDAKKTESNAEKKTAEKKVNPKKDAREKGKEKRDGQPESEDYAKWKARELEKAKGKDARRGAHDAKDKKAKQDRTKKELDEDYDVNTSTGSSGTITNGKKASNGG